LGFAITLETEINLFFTIQPLIQIPEYLLVVSVVQHLKPSRAFLHSFGLCVQLIPWLDGIWTVLPFIFAVLSLL
jgi:hypothetical protein